MPTAQQSLALTQVALASPLALDAVHVVDPVGSALALTLRGVTLGVALAEGLAVGMVHFARTTFLWSRLTLVW